MPGFADELPPGWGVWLLPDPDVPRAPMSSGSVNSASARTLALP